MDLFDNVIRMGTYLGTGRLFLFMIMYRVGARTLHRDGDVSGQPGHRRLTQHARKAIGIVARLTLITFVIEMGLTLNEVPSVSVVTALICSRHRGGIPLEHLDEQECISDAQVVAETNRFLMLNTVINSIISLLVALIFPAAADIYGRKKIFMLCVIGILLNNAWSTAVAHSVPNVNVEAIWSANVAILLGGGFRVGEALVFTMLSDIANDQWRATCFQIAICGFFLGEIIGSLVGGALLQKSLWLPLYVGLGFIGAGLLLILLLPETLHMRIPSAANQPAQAPTPGSLAGRIKQVWISTKATTASFPGRGIYLLLPAASLVIPIASTASFLMIQVLPTRYGTDFSQSSRYQAVRAVTNLVVLIICLPLLSYWLCRRSTLRRDKFLNIGSSLFVIVGMCLIAVASSLPTALAGLVVFSLGAGVPGLARAMIAQVMDQKHMGALFGCLAVVEQLGILVCSLSMSALLQKGLADGGGDALGYPFWFAFAALVVVCVCSWFARPRKIGPVLNEDGIELVDRGGQSGDVDRAEAGSATTASRE